MANSLQEQLLKTGLTDKKKVAQIKKEKFKANRKNRSQNIQPEDENKRAALQAIQEKKEKDRLLNQQKEEKIKAKAIIAQIKQIILQNKIEAYQGELNFNFQDQNKIKSIQLSEKIQQSIVNGQIAIVKFEKYYLVPSGVAEKIAQRDNRYVIVLNERINQEDSESIDDEYADYIIPDDLMW